MTTLLLLSGGLDSAAVASIWRPKEALFVDYGQRPADGERRAARAIASFLSLPLRELTLDLSIVGAGLLAGRRPLPTAPSPEWFPFRNQMLITLAAACAVNEGHDEVSVGLVKEDGQRHADGTENFLNAMSALTSSQEQGPRVVAPGIRHSSSELVSRAGLPVEALMQTVSCHVAPLACGSCPGCRKRAAVLHAVGD